jgi:hypothetical protein
MGNISCRDEARHGRPLSTLGSALEHFLETLPVASARIIAMHFNVSHSIITDILSRELGLRKFSRRWARDQLSGPQKKVRIDTSVELLALLDQYSDL